MVKIYVYNKQIWILVTWHQCSKSQMRLLLVSVRITLNETVGRGSITECHANPLTIRYGKVLYFDWKLNWVLSYKTNVLLDCLLTILMAQSVLIIPFWVGKFLLAGQKRTITTCDLPIRPNLDYFKHILVPFDIYLAQIFYRPRPI